MVITEIVTLCIIFHSHTSMCFWLMYFIRSNDAAMKKLHNTSAFEGIFHAILMFPYSDFFAPRMAVIILYFSLRIPLH